MDGGLRLITLERSEVNWLYWNKNSIFSKQFDKEVSIILTNEIILCIVNVGSYS